MNNTTTPDYGVTPNAVVLPLFACMAMVMCAVPFYLLWKRRNIATCLLIFFIVLQNFFDLINAALWPTDDFSTWWNGVGLCDIQSYLRSPITAGIATCMAGVSRNLAKAVDTDNANLLETPAMRRRRMAIDFIFCLGIPVLQLGLYYLVQVDRYYIITITGCVNVVDNSWPSIVIIHMWAPVFAVINAYYAVLVIYRLRKHRHHFSNTLSSTGSGLTATRFLKLFMLSVSLLIIYLPVTLYFLYNNIKNSYPLIPYSFSRVHNPVTWDPIIFLRLDDIPGLQWDGWIPISMGFLIVFFYGIGDEAIDLYRDILVKAGLGDVWPSLKQPRQPRRNSRSKWTRHFNLVNRAMKYFDKGDRQGSVAGSNRYDSYSLFTVAHYSNLYTITKQKLMASLSSACRNGSLPTFDRISITNSNTVTPQPALTQADLEQALTPNYDPSHELDAITPAPSSPRYLEPVLSSSQLIESSRTEQAPRMSHRNIFSTFRTHINVPIPALTFSKKAEANHISATLDSTLASPGLTSPSLQPPMAQNSMVETTIWSNPRIGTRAYRELERERVESNDSIQNPGSSNSASASASREQSKPRVVVNTVLRRMEEDTPAV
ncbi:pheromone A receptor-domain-containing protein [Xylogone sp. PMI_703]|nr:pheromone A receptor-domain-containing protein [Xylogone sp. PMI_703]